MYGSTAEAMAGFSKNAVEIARGIPQAVVAALALAVLYLGPLSLAIAGSTMALGAVAVTAMLFGAVWGIFGLSPLCGLLYPLATILTVAVLVRSSYWYLTGRVQWKGRSYSPRDESVQ
jgi:hypothetical protein